MNLQLNLRLLILFICFVGLLTFYYTHNGKTQEFKLPKIFDMPQIHPQPTQEILSSNTQRRYSFASPRCKMLDLDPWDRSVKKYLTKPQSLACSHLPSLTYIDQLENLTNILKIHKKNYKKFKVSSNHMIKCCYSLITRINQDPKKYNSSADNLIDVSKCEEFTNQVALPENAEFVFVKCSSYQEGKKNGKEFYKDMHPLVPILPSVSNKILKQKEKLNTNITTEIKNVTQSLKKPNIVILGIDSVSKINLKRIMPKTLKYLQDNSWIELNGYNKIGENTFPNLMAILSREPMERLNFWWKNSSKKMDDCPIIWKDFSAAGYVTLYAEDTPTISTFNFMRTGFVEKPTDYYMRPFMLGAHKLLSVKVLNGLPVCTGSVLVIDHILNYAKRFFRIFRGYNHFSLLWTNSLSHNDLNAPKSLDNSIHKFLGDISDLGIYESSIVFILSDHGVRFGNIRETFIGYIEERLPFMFIWFPEWFREKYTEQYVNVLINQYRLTTPYDIYVTLKAILNSEAQKEDHNEFEKKHQKPVSLACPKCTGLLEIQPLNRSCTDASIDVNWCLCSEFRDISVQEKIVSDVGDYIFKYIVDRTHKLMKLGKVKKNLCTMWKFSKIFRSQEVIDIGSFVINKFNDKKKELKERIFVVIIELNPGHTKFEATVKTYFNTNTENREFNFLEYPKRLDSIYKTSKCVNSSSLKHYCYCAKL